MLWWNLIYWTDGNASDKFKKKTITKDLRLIYIFENLMCYISEWYILYLFTYKQYNEMNRMNYSINKSTENIYNFTKIFLCQSSCITLACIIVGLINFHFISLPEISLFTLFYCPALLYCWIDQLEQDYFIAGLINLKIILLLEISLLLGGSMFTWLFYCLRFFYC